ncbi:MAG: hypothetical protein ACRC4W_05565 [Treponemataceae bacterium]
MKKIVVFFSISILFSQLAFCVKWSISATAFEGKASSIDRKSKVSQSTSKSVNELLPALVLNELQVNGTRLITSDEAVTRLLHALSLERQTLFEDLSKKIAERDNVLFSATSTSDFKSKIKTAEKEIEKVRKALQKNINYMNKPIETLRLALKDKSRPEFSFTAGNFTTSVTNRAVDTKSLEADEWTLQPGEVLPITLWKYDNALLFEKQKETENNTAFQKRVLDEGLSCIISGSFFVRDDFIHVKTRADFFPRKPGEDGVFIEISDVGSIQNLPDLARSIAFRMMPSIMNIKPIELNFNISPPEVNNRLRIAIDGIILQVQDNKTMISPGEHIITISADGYKSEETWFHFTGNDAYKISVDLQPETHIALNVNALKTEGKFYFNALSEDIQNKRGVLPSNTVLGQFIADNGVSTYFVSEIDSEIESGNLTGDLKPLNTSIKDEIEKKRKVMYGSYSALMLSLPLLFLSIGTAESSWKPEDRKLWELVKWSSIGLTTALGVNFISQLIVYLVTANKFVPAQVKMQDASSITERKAKRVKKERVQAPKKEKKPKTKPAKKATAEEEAEPQAEESTDGILLVLPPDTKIE